MDAGTGGGQRVEHRWNYPDPGMAIILFWIRIRSWP